MCFPFIVTIAEAIVAQEAECVEPLSYREVLVLEGHALGPKS